MSGRQGVKGKTASALDAVSKIETKLDIEKNDSPEGDKTLSGMLKCSCCDPKGRPEYIDFNRVLLGDFPITRYREQVKWKPVHWGQLKLLLSEIEFLTPYQGNIVHNVIYAGASPGIHIPILAKMFPKFIFTLVDPQPSMIEEGNDKYKKIFVIQNYMTEGLSESFRLHKDNILFISDVRVGADKTRKETPQEMQRRIHNDMIAQQKWLRIMNPVSSMLKFRLPWDLHKKKITEYSRGKIYFPVFGKRLTHEARLVVERGAGLTRYDNGLYEGQMACFNQFLRPAMFDLNGYIGCFDCTSFRIIVYNYLVATSKSRKMADVDRKCKEIVTELKRLKNEWEEIQESRGIPSAAEEDED
jgi:hypothetical protein